MIGFRLPIVISVILLVGSGGVVAGTNVVALDGDTVPAIEELSQGTSPFDADTDADGLGDGEELNEYGTDPTTSDTDDDRLNDGEEINEYDTDPLRPDTDSDGLDDGDELEEYETKPLEVDTDSDGLEDGKEIDVGSDPTREDTDSDGLDDASEVKEHGTDPADTDSDNDELSDREEVEEYDTNPTRTDSDSDGLEDGEELRDHDTDPTVADTDNDDLEDGDEVEDYGTDPNVPDTDGDGISDGKEVGEYDSDPTKIDTDNDGLEDSEEIDEFDTDPVEEDSDRDGVPDGAEVNQYETDPNEEDTDDDGLPDYAEIHGDGLLDEADPLKRDVLVEIDYMSGDMPSRSDIRDTERAFSDAPIENPDGSSGVNLIIDVDEQIDQESPTDGRELDDLMAENFDHEDRGAFYGVAVQDTESYSEKVAGFSTGEYENGQFAFMTDGENDEDWIDGVPAHLIVHELGHSLGLNNRVYEGIDSKDVSKQEYDSAMNYNSDVTQVEYNTDESFDDWDYIEANQYTPDVDVDEIDES